MMFNTHLKTGGIATKLRLRTAKYGYQFLFRPKDEEDSSFPRLRSKLGQTGRRSTFGQSQTATPERPDRNGNVVQRETLARIEVLNGQRQSVL
jgi:hypothetical protein